MSTELPPNLFKLPPKAEAVVNKWIAYAKTDMDTNDITVAIRSAVAESLALPQPLPMVGGSTGPVLRASAVDLRRALLISQTLTKAGVLFVPSPVLSEADHQMLVGTVNTRLAVLENRAEG